MEPNHIFDPESLPSIDYKIIQDGNSNILDLELIPTDPVTEKPSVTIFLDYTKNSHILSGTPIKDIYVNFRMEVLREVEWAVWKGKLVNNDLVKKGWAIKKENLSDLEDALKKYEIPYNIVQLQKKAPKNPKSFWSFASQHWEQAKQNIENRGIKPDRKNIVVEIKNIMKK